MKPYPFLFAVFLLLTLSTCIQPFEAEVPTAVEGLVVSAALTTVPGQQEVRLQSPAAYTTQALQNAIRNAQVWVEDEKGERQFYVENMRIPGQYLPQNRDFVGVIGKTYTLHIITADNHTYVSKPELLRATPPIKRIYPEAILAENSILGNALHGYKVLLDTEDSATKGDYYRWTWVHYEQAGFCLTYQGFPFGASEQAWVGIACCENPCWDIYRCNQNCINVQSDALINGRTISQQPIHSIPYCPRDYYIEVQQRSISRDAYNYWRTVDQLANNNGSIFDAAPAAVRGNIRCTSDSTQLVYGLFEVSDVYETGVFIDRIPQTSIPTVFTCTPTPLSANPFDCRPCVESAFRTRVKPKYWTK